MTRGLDVVGVNVRNNDRAVVATITFTKVMRGDLIVAVTARHTRPAAGVRIVSLRRPVAGDRTFVAPGSFARTTMAARCPGVTGRWDVAASSVRVRMPSSCLRAGN